MTTYFEYQELKTQRPREVIPGMLVSERALEDDEQNELRKEIAMLAVMRAMQPEEAT
jgi:hypothetical protein